MDTQTEAKTEKVEKTGPNAMALHVVSKPAPRVYSTMDDVATLISGLAFLSYNDMTRLLELLAPLRYKHYTISALIRIVETMQADYNGPTE